MERRTESWRPNEMRRPKGGVSPLRCRAHSRVPAGPGPRLRRRGALHLDSAPTLLGSSCPRVTVGASLGPKGPQGRTRCQRGTGLETLRTLPQARRGSFPKLSRSRERSPRTVTAWGWALCGWAGRPRPPLTPSLPVSCARGAFQVRRVVFSPPRFLPVSVPGEGWHHPSSVGGLHGPLKGS